MCTLYIYKFYICIHQILILGVLEHTIIMYISLIRFQIITNGFHVCLLPPNLSCLTDEPSLFLSHTIRKYVQSDQYCTIFYLQSFFPHRHKFLRLFYIIYFYCLATRITLIYMCVCVYYIHTHTHIYQSSIKVVIFWYILLRY